MLKAPHWEMMIVWYFFLGGIAGGAYFTAAVADVFGTARDRAVSRIGYMLSLPLVAICGVLLVADLGVPTRFLKMLGAFKFWDPMSIGAWALGVFGAFTFVSTVLSFTSSDAAVRVRRGVGVIGIFFGFFIASYTGVLLSNSALPFWTDARLMGALFLASGASTGMAAIAVILALTGSTGGSGWEKLKKADRYAIVFELLVLAGFLALLGSAAAPILSGKFATLFWGGLVVAGLVVPLVLQLVAARIAPLGALAAVLVLIGGFVLRYVVVMSV